MAPKINLYPSILSTYYTTTVWTSQSCKISSSIYRLYIPKVLNLFKQNLLFKKCEQKRFIINTCLIQISCALAPKISFVLFVFLHSHTYSLSNTYACCPQAETYLAYLEFIKTKVESLHEIWVETSEQKHSPGSTISRVPAPKIILVTPRFTQTYTLYQIHYTQNTHTEM